MYRIATVKFKPTGKAYYFDPLDFDLKKDDNVIVETVRGLEFGTIVSDIKELSPSAISRPLKGVVRKATDEDVIRKEENVRFEENALSVCEEKIALHKLDMKLIEAEYAFDRSKITFYFSADGRVDFRELVRDLATVLKTRIELRQIGVRDESKALGSIGTCGRGLCCAQWLSDFVPVSIKMAKCQGLSLNPGKISGVCGRLMCCLKYEQDLYEQLAKEMPRVGTPVTTPDGEGVATAVSLLRGMVKVHLNSMQDKESKEYSAADVTPIKRKKRERRGAGKKFNKTIEESKNL